MESNPVFVSYNRNQYLEIYQRLQNVHTTEQRYVGWETENLYYNQYMNAFIIDMQNMIMQVNQQEEFQRIMIVISNSAQSLLKSRFFREVLGMDEKYRSLPPIPKAVGGKRISRNKLRKSRKQKK